MTDVDGLVRDCLERHADEAPTGERLLAAVHDRSRRLRRRRRIWAAALSVVAVGGLAAGAPAATGARTAPVPGPVRGVAGAGSPSPAVSGPPAAAPGSTPAAPAPAGSPTAPAALRLAAPAYPEPSFPLRPGASAGIWKAPVVVLDGGALRAYFEAKDPVGQADVTITVTGTRPAFGAAAGPVSEAQRRVRGRNGTLRRVTVSPADQLVLYWPESATRWVALQTDDTYTDAQVVRFAEELVDAALPLDAGLRPDLAPTGMVPDTISPGALSLRPADAPPGTDVITCTLLRPQRLTGAAVAVGRYRAALTRDGSGARIAVDVDDRGVTLLVRVPARYAVSDADLIRFAEGIHLTDRAESRDD